MKKNKKKTTLINFVFIFFIGFLFASCSGKSLTLNINEESRVLIINPELHKFDYRLQVTSYGGLPADLFSRFYRLPKPVAQKVIHMMNHSFRACLFGEKTFFVPHREISGVRSVLFRIEDGGEISYWGWGYPESKNKDVVMRRVYYRKSDQLLRYSNSRCYQSAMPHELFDELIHSKYEVVQLDLPEKSPVVTQEASTSKEPSFIQIAAFITGFFGGIISAMLFMMLTPKFRDWPFKKRLQIAAFYGLLLGVLAMGIFGN